MNIVIISYIAAFCSMVSFIPQVLHTLKTRQTKGISLHMYIILGTGALLWTIYGIFLKDGAIILTNSVIFLFALQIIFLKLKHG